MSQLIALIIAIALGAIVTAIGYVFLGDAFTKNSEKGVALQFINQATQAELAMSAYRAENAKSAWAVGLNFENTAAELTSKGYLKEGYTTPQGNYSGFYSDGDAFLVVSDPISSGGITEAVCQQINKLSGDTLPTNSTDADSDGIPLPNTPIINEATIKTAIEGSRFACFEDVNGTGNATTYFYIYNVE